MFALQIGKSVMFTRTSSTTMLHTEHNNSYFPSWFYLFLSFCLFHISWSIQISEQIFRLFNIHEYFLQISIFIHFCCCCWNSVRSCNFVKHFIIIIIFLCSIQYKPTRSVFQCCLSRSIGSGRYFTIVSDHFRQYTFTL